MNLYEYQAKNLLKDYNLPVLKGKICFSLQEIENYLSNTIGPWAAKCQIKAGGRGNSGGICVTSSVNDIFIFAKKWFGHKLITNQTTSTGEQVNSILLEPAVNFSQEFYLGILLDRESSQIICITSTQGGVNIESVKENNPDLIHKTIINPLVGAHPYQGRILACKLGLTGKNIHQFSDIIVKISHILIENDLILVEINPLVIIDNTLLCLDAKVVIDQNSIFRQSKLFKKYINNNHEINDTPNKIHALHNVNYVPLEKGNIGCVVNGAGLAMATMDLIKEFGGMPANFLDIGGGISKENFVSALNLLLKNIHIQAILINIFGGIVCCNLIADGIITAISANNRLVPIIVRFEGNNATLGRNKLINSNLNIFITNYLTEAIQQVISMVKKDVNFN